MVEAKAGPRYKIGDKVRVDMGRIWNGVVTEIRYVPMGSGRIHYRIQIPMDPEPLWVEVEEHNLVQE